MKIPMRIFLSGQTAKFWEPDCGGFHQRALTRSTGIRRWKSFILLSKVSGAFVLGEDHHGSKARRSAGGTREVRQVFNDTETEVLWLIVGAPEKELEEGETIDQKLLYPSDPKQLTKKLMGLIGHTDELIA